MQRQRPARLSRQRWPEQPAGRLLPWFEHPGKTVDKHRIIFGHWAALEGKADHHNVFALDTGCVWGNTLTAMRLEDQQLFSVPSLKQPE
ncbi:hypothetical protein [Aliamphritea spongicola]|nr:hypothetical protein [Aliamphritea spongicola]